MLIAHASEVHNIIEQALEPQNVFGYPYYYIGSESWFDESPIKQYKLEPFLHGLIGASPWFPGALSNDVLNRSFEEVPGLEAMYTYSQEITDRLHELWNKTLITHPELVYNLEIPTVYSYYAWDSMTSLINSLKLYDIHFGGIDTIWNGTYNQSTVMDYLNLILTDNNTFGFVGATGNVSFDSNGDRAQAFYLLGNVIDHNGTINFFGVHSSELDLTSQIDIEKNIVWPQEFDNNDILPQSSVITYDKLDALEPSGVITMYVFVQFCVYSDILYIIITIVYFLFRLKQFYNFFN